MTFYETVNVKPVEADSFLVNTHSMNGYKKSLQKKQSVLCCPLFKLYNPGGNKNDEFGIIFALYFAFK